jgi:hypothetical protein
MVAGFPTVAEGHAQFVELGALHLIHADIAVPREVDDLAQRAVRIFGYEDLIDAAPALDRLARGVAADDKIRQLVLRCVRAFRGRRRGGALRVLIEFRVLVELVVPVVLSVRPAPFGFVVFRPALLV